MLNITSLNQRVNYLLSIVSGSSPLTGNLDVGGYNLLNVNRIVDLTDLHLGVSAGLTNAGTNSIGIGYEAGKTDQGAYAVTLGYNAGLTNAGIGSVGIGYEAGKTDQGDFAVALGKNSGGITQSTQAVAIGNFAGYDTQGESCIAVGRSAGRENQSDFAVAVGYQAGTLDAGINSISIGKNAGQTDIASDSICIGSDTISKGTNSISIGKDASTSNFTSAVAIGDGAIATADNQISLGNASVSKFRIGGVIQPKLIYAGAYGINWSAGTGGSQRQNLFTGVSLPSGYTSWNIVATNLWGNDAPSLNEGFLCLSGYTYIEGGGGSTFTLGVNIFDAGNTCVNGDPVRFTYLMYACVTVP